ncbi:hypothetical protein BSL78_02583 [Apostichopus japonicus]|uniref:HMG box domain-containing protein n=1 Tax=Stichopus japonicus TaxID=307972 RepID=A0A2G8LJP4_STIJA|nr:hypothetical protein BSL78_02583 [Apostichopus japonicus]
MEEHSELAQNIPKNGGKLSPEQDLNRRKCLALKRKCDGVDSDNKKLLNRIYHVRKTISRLSREKRGLMKKLNELKDSYKTIERTTPLEDGPFMYLLGFADPAGHRTNIKPIIDPRTGFPVVTKPKVNKPVSREPTSTPVSRKRRKDGVRIEKEKDPNAPKKPANAFLMYCQEKRLSASLANNADKPRAEMSHADLTKQLAKEWNDLEEKDKKRYYVAYEKEKAKYVEEVRQYSKDLMIGSAKSVSKASVPNVGTMVKTTIVNGTGPPSDLTKKFLKDPVMLPSSKPSVVSSLLKQPKVEGAVEVDPYSFDGD